MYCSVVQSDEPWPNWENEDGIHRLKMGSNDFWNNFTFLKCRNSSKKYAPNLIPTILCTRRCQTKQLGPSRVDILSKIHKLYTDRKNVTDLLYLVLHLAHKVTYYFQLFSLVLVSVLRTSINVLSKSKSKNYVTWIANLTKLFLSLILSLASSFKTIK